MAPDAQEVVSEPIAQSLINFDVPHTLALITPNDRSQQHLLVDSVHYGYLRSVYHFS
jgi:hypothetical protein